MCSSSEICKSNAGHILIGHLLIKTVVKVVSVTCKTQIRILCSGMAATSQKGY